MAPQLVNDLRQRIRTALAEALFQYQSHTKAHEHAVEDTNDDFFRPFIDEIKAQCIRHDEQ